MPNAREVPGDDNLLVPTTTEEVTEEWLAKALNLDLAKGTLVVTSNIHAGSGYLSNMLRAKFLKSNSQGKKDELSFVVKLLPEEQFTRDMVTDEKMDKSELGVYLKLLPEFIKEVPSLEPYVCPFLYGKVQDENVEKGIKYSSVLVLKDLACDGYFSKPYKNHKISSKELSLGIDFLAKFHFAGNLIELKKGKRLNELFDFFPEWYYPNENENREFTMQASFDTGFAFTRQFIKDYATNVNPQASELANKLISEMINPLEAVSRKILNFVLSEGQKNPIAIHGDLWQNNILFSEGPNPIIVIDWQLLGYSDPVYDLGMLIPFSLQDDISIENLKRYAKQYYDTVEELYAERSAKGLPVPNNRRSWDKFWECFSTLGLVYLFMLIVMSGEICVTHPENNPKMVSMFKFFHEEAKITEFLLKNAT